MNTNGGKRSCGLVVEWLSRLAEDGEGKLRDDELGESPLVVVYQIDVAGHLPLAIGQRVTYRREYDVDSNLYLAREVQVVEPERCRGEVVVWASGIGGAGQGQLRDAELGAPLVMVRPSELARQPALLVGQGVTYRRQYDPQSNCYWAAEVCLAEPA